MTTDKIKMKPKQRPESADNKKRDWDFLFYTLGGLPFPSGLLSLSAGGFKF